MDTTTDGAERSSHTNDASTAPVAQQQFDTAWAPDPHRYEAPGAVYRRCGRSGLDLPAISLGLWHNFGDDHPLSAQRDILRTAFDLGITQFDLANNYGIPYGSAEANFGHHMDHDFRAHRDEMIITTKAGYDMWAGPYGAGGGGRKYILSSLDQSLARMHLDYVDIFYSHRFDATTPVEETVLALDQAVRSGRALYAGISSYPVEATREAVVLAREIHLPLVIHQPRYSLLDRGIEDGVLQTCGDLGLGLAVFSPLAQGLLTSKYLGSDPVPEGARMREQRFLHADVLTEDRLTHLRALDALARDRGQTLAEMSLQWLLKDPRVTTVLVGASSPGQLHDSVGALAGPAFTEEELGTIDAHSRAASLV